MPTYALFLAAERTIVGPPISMFSIASSNATFGFAIVSRKGYKFTTTKSIGKILCSSIAA